MSSRANLTIAKLLWGITEDNLRDHSSVLASFGPRSILEPRNTRQALDYLTGKLESFGYSITEERYGPGVGDVNLFVERTGTIGKDRVFEVAAHFDTVPGSPGADDNGSGVVGVLAIAEALSKTNLRNTVRFCLFGGEEQSLLGSTHHVEYGERKADATIVFEMIGYRTFEPDSQRTPVRIPILFSPPTTGDFIVPVANWKSQLLVNNFLYAARQYVPDLKTFTVSPHGQLLKDASRSDHLPYWRAGRKAMMLTDTADFRNPHYHKGSDLPVLRQDMVSTPAMTWYPVWLGKKILLISLFCGGFKDLSHCFFLR